MRRALIPIVLAMLALPVAAQTVAIRTSRPRVFADSAALAAAAAKKTGTAGQQALYNAYVSYVNTYCKATDPIAVGNQNCAEYVAGLYAMDPTTWASRVPQICQWIDFQVSRIDANNGYLDSDADLRSGNAVRWNMPRIAHAWDAIGGACDATVTANIRYAGTRTWELKNVNSTEVDGKWLAYKKPHMIANNIGVGEFAAVALLGIALYDPDEYPAPATTWLPEILSLTRSMALPCLNNSTAVKPYESCFGGSWPEGMSEYAPETAYFFLELIDLWRVGTTNVDLWPEVTGGFLRYMADWSFHGLSPAGAPGTHATLYQSWLYRDVTASGTGNNYYGFLWRIWREMYRRLDYQFARQGDTTYKAYSQFYLKTIMPWMYLDAARNLNFTMDIAYFEDPDSAGTDWRGVLGLNHVTPFMVLSRSDWTADATWVGAMAMQEGGDHMHGDSGHFQIYRKGKWLAREIPGWLDMLNNSPTSLHNALTLDWHGTFSGASRYGGKFYDETIWPRMVRTASGYRAKCVEARSYCAAEMDLTPAYRFKGNLITHDITSVRRHWLYLKPDITVVADRIKYVGTLQAQSIFHVQSEKGAATIDGNRATISNATQRLHVNVVEPASPSFTTSRLNYCRVMGARKISASTADVFLDCGHGYPVGSACTITGATGEWSALNATWTVALPSSPTPGLGFSDGVAYNGERIRVTATDAFAGVTGAFPAALVGVPVTNRAKNTYWNDPDLLPAAITTRILHDPYRLDVVADYANEHGFLVVLEGADSTDTPITVTRRSGTASFASSFTQDGTAYVVAAPSGASVVLPMTYTVPAGSATNIVMGLASSTTYNVAVADGTVTIDATGSGNDIQSDEMGLLYFDSDSATSPLAFGSPASVPGGQVNAAYTNTTMACIGGTLPYAWDLSSGTLPTGMTLGESTGVLGGTPTQSGTFSITVRCTDDATDTATRAFSLVISAVPLVVTESPLSAGTVGAAYSASLVAQGGTEPYTWASQGTLPPGLALSSAGVLSGTPTTAGSWTFEGCATDSAVSPQTDCGPFAVTIQAVSATLEIVQTSLPTPEYGRPYAGMVTGVGGEGSAAYAWSISSGSLCSWATATETGPSNGNQYVIGGTAETLESCTFTVQLSDGVANTTREFTLTPVRTSKVTIRSVVAGGTTALIRAGYSVTTIQHGGDYAPALSQHQSCTATVYDAGLTAVSTATVASGAAYRDYLVTGLTASTAYTAVVDCGYYTSASYSFTTRSAATGTKTVTLSSGAHSTATHARLQYGATSGLGSQTDLTACGSGCTLSITGLTAETPVYVRKVFADSGGNVIATGAIAVHIPR